MHTRGADFTVAQLQVADRWLRDADSAEAVVLANYRRLAGALRKAVANDRAQYLDGLAAEVAHGNLGDAKSLYRVLRRAFPAARSSKRQGILPLPALKLEDGTYAQTTERASAWRSHFAAQEAGVAVDDAGYQRAFSASVLQPRSLDAQLLPTLAAVEQHILAAKTSRAAGPDGITAELLRLDPPIIARQLLPVFLKSCLRVQEPITFRGGELFCLAKKAGHALTCEAYRSILVSSVPGKLYHRCLRDSLKPLLLSTQPAFQAGVASGQGIEGPALAIKSFFALCGGKRIPASLAFFALQAAFYQVLRQALVPSTEDDTELLRVLHCLRLPPQAIHELKDKLTQAALLPTLGHAVAVVQDLFRGTWFRLSGFPEVVVTKRGSRPGDPTADLMFGFTLSALAHAVQQCLETRGLLPNIPQADDRPDSLTAEGPVPLGLPSWADDFVAPQTGTSPSDLLDRTGSSVSTVVDFATSAGMTVKFGRDKTAILLPPEVLSSESAAFDTDADGHRVLPLRNGVTGDLFLVPVVESYRHLGGIVTSTGTPIPDVHFRFSQAQGTLRPLRRRLFGAREIPVRTRASILRALIVAKFTHSAAAMLITSACHSRVWERQYLALWRSLFHRRSAETQVHSFQVLRQAHASSPPLSLARARAGFLLRLHKSGPFDLLALLWDHWSLHPASSWFSQLVADMRHVSLYAPDIKNLLSAGDTVAALLDALALDCTVRGG